MSIDILKDKMRRDLVHTYYTHGFDDEEDLYFYVQHILGYTIPRVKFCPEHVAPWDFVRDIFFEKVTLSLAYGSRGSGKTFLTALLNHLEMLYKQCSIEVGTAAAILEQANRGYKYFKSFFEDPILGEFIDTSIQTKTVLTNGSILHITAGTIKGFNGLHVSKLRIDEVELLTYELLAEAMGISMSQKDKKSGRLIQASDCLSSTRKYASGTMTRLLEEAEQRHMAVYSFCIWENIERCTRQCKGDKDWGDCVAWDVCQGKAHECSGWYPISDFINKVLSVPREVFHTQFENKSPSGGYKVFMNSWDESIHVLSWVEGGKYKSFYSVFHEKEIPHSWKRIGGIDFGANFATLFIAIEPKYDIWIVYFEYFYAQERLLAHHAQHIRNGPGFRVGMKFFADPSGKQSILEMRSYGLRGVVPAMNNLREGVDEIKKRLEVQASNGLPKLFVMDNCLELRREFREWEHGTLDSGRPDLESFEDGNDHCLDALRYACFSYPRLPKVSYRFATVPEV